MNARTDGVAAAPIERRDRVIAIDAARGFALLGIFAVNVQSFGEPFGEFILGRPGDHESVLAQALFYLVKIFCEGKFYPLFSMLFGMGLVLQMSRARQGSFGMLYARRLALLLLIGFVHATLIWYGDILFLYALAGVVLLLASRLSGKVLLGIGAGIVLFVACACGTVWGGLSVMSERTVESSFVSAAESAGTVDASDGEAGEAGEVGEGGDEADGGASGVVGEDAGEVVSDEMGPGEAEPGEAGRGRAFARLVEGLGNQTIQEGPSDPAWIALEKQAFGEGPWLDAFLFNLMCWVISMVAGLFSYSWHVVGLFFVGAGLMKLGVFEAGNERGVAWRRMMLLGGVGLGLPGAVLAAILPTIGATSAPAYIVSTMLLFICGPLMGLMYICLIWRLAAWGGRNRVAGAVVGVLARVGRMALTNYLLHSLIFTGIFHWWGLGLFGETTRPQRLAMVPLVFGVLCVTSWLWLRWFGMGPLEWLWRTGTYWKVQRLRA